MSDDYQPLIIRVPDARQAEQPGTRALAREFIERAADDPTMATDEDVLTIWFSAVFEAGYDWAW